MHILNTGLRFHAVYILLYMIFILSGCGSHVYHVVQRGETLYSIGWAYGYDYRQVAQWNGIEPPFYLNPGQRLRVAPPAGQSAASFQEYRPPVSQTVRSHNPAPVVGPSSGSESSGPGSVRETSRQIQEEAASTVTKVKQFLGMDTLKWRWPTETRRITTTFLSKDAARQGIDISGELGSPVYVAAPGRVVYAGSGLASYGRLIIVKHNEKYLSAYAHSKKLHVKEGDDVKAGQKIADMGSPSTNGIDGRAMLHFEIRRNGKPVDPLRYLPR